MQIGAKLLVSVARAAVKTRNSRLIVTSGNVKKLAELEPAFT